MSSNLYHTLSFIPATEVWEMPAALEALAQQLVKRGKLRINADHERNYVRHGEMTFTTRELTDPDLSAATYERVARHVAPAAGIHGIDDLFVQLRTDLKKARGVSALKEIRVARVLVQSAEPAVIQLLIASGTEVFVSYSHNVADLMPVHEWQGHGTASGLQATETSGTSVYVSAGGDPFFEGQHKTYTTDGFPALARMVVIAGQELGHFADLRRTARGIIGRHSTDINARELRADPTARAAWLADQKTVAELRTSYLSCGISWLLRAEKSLAFYHTRLRYSPPWIFYQGLRFVAWLWFIINSTQQKLCILFNIFPKSRLGESIEAYLADMAFNLTPDADVYRHPDPLIEEAIIVLEAVARVPQQVHKWGHLAVLQAWPMLYKFYYGTVISACRAAVSNTIEAQNIDKLQNIMIYIRRSFRATPGYYP